ncbi:c-type cytochrome [Ferruginibacter sp. SUN106]|uniref:c-type cytochrome n=1 Tax=Ferruginibacter sp. SUN106 TaxID=2978348 RepID=UPI003D35C229
MKHPVIAMALIFVAVLVACKSKEETTKPTATKEELIKRGEYLVQISGCNDCHSPKKPGPNGPELVPELMLSGYSQDMPIPQGDKNVLAAGFSVFAPDLTAATGPWGTSFSANITPDTATGIGGWTEEQFKKSLTKGKFKGQDGGRQLLPPMPWFNYAKMADEDVKAIFSYLKSIKPVNNAVRFPIKPGQQ